VITPRLRRRLVVVALAGLGVVGLMPGVAVACTCNAALPFHDSAAGRHLTSLPVPSQPHHAVGARAPAELLSTLGVALLVIAIGGSGVVTIRRMGRRRELGAG
jgi:hypothetical protein